MRLRRYRAQDLPALAQLFYDTVHTVNARDYDEGQLNAWAPGEIDEPRWRETLAAHFSLVAEGEAGGVLGFADLDEAAGYLDRLYVHAAHQGHPGTPVPGSGKRQGGLEELPDSGKGGTGRHSWPETHRSLL